MTAKDSGGWTWPKFIDIRLTLEGGEEEEGNPGENLYQESEPIESGSQALWVRTGNLFTTAFIVSQLKKKT